MSSLRYVYSLVLLCLMGDELAAKVSAPFFDLSCEIEEPTLF